MASTDAALPEPTKPSEASAQIASLPSGQRTTYNIGTRRSQLALWQTDRAAELLKKLYPNNKFDIHAMATMGDKNQVTALHQFNAKSLWTHELEAQLVTGQLDIIVHSLKDMPTQLPADCALAAAAQRTERRDAVIMSPSSAAKGWTTLADLPDGSIVGTSSIRRIAQLNRLHPGLKSIDVRGNINTRLAKLDAPDAEYAALILAATGVQRIGFGDRVTSFLNREEHQWFGPVGQGALGLECRSSDVAVRDMCTALMAEDGPGNGTSKGLQVWYECLAERMLLRTLEGGCSVPIGVDTVWEGTDTLTLHAIVLSVDGKQVVQNTKTAKIASKEDAEACGLALAGDLVQQGAGKILEEITLNRKVIAEGGGA